VPCRCTREQWEKGRFAYLERYSNLGPLTRLTFETIIPQGRRGDAPNQERFRRAFETARSFAQTPQGWLVLLGPSGSGKTHLAAAIANLRIGQGHPALFIIVSDLLDHLRATFNPQSELSYDELFTQVRNAPLLVLDDLGQHSTTPWAQEKLFQIINHRFNLRLPTVVTSRVPLEEMEGGLSTRLGDPDLSQVYLVEERHPSPGEEMGGLELPLLKGMTFDRFEARPDLEREQRQSLNQALRLARNFAQTPESWLVLLGTNGCGKTHLAAAIANQCLAQGKPVLFVGVPDLLDHLRATFNPQSQVTHDRLFEQVRKAPLLILDDLGQHHSTPWAEAKLYQIIDYRYSARLPTVITSCQTLEEFDDRISSRMGDHSLSTVWVITAPDYRWDRKEGKATPPEPRPRRGRPSFTREGQIR
jgi:DNA replication protein DnaC